MLILIDLGFGIEPMVSFALLYKIVSYLWMISKGSQNFRVMALDLCGKQP